ncbi:MAG: gfo/Idh/MocA family oxidoreductase [Sediminibacterium sp.]|jgi:predicted dehydrogenase|nr:MAG: gfo/Idh/MocA family oxidoreductase [Sediminibacterium sp.]
MNDSLTRAAFLQKTSLASAALLLSNLELFAAAEEKIIKVAIIGCGSVSNRYIVHLQSSPLVKIVSLCDIKQDRAEAQNKKYNIGASTYNNINALLKGNAFDLMLTLTDMQMHGALNKIALQAGKHVWSEKPLANTYAEGKALVDYAKLKGVRIWGAPAVVTSPQFEFMSKTIQQGKLGKLASAHGQYGHTGPTWSSFFYEPLGGSMPDLGVYNMATLTGLLGPAKSVMAMTSIVNKEREIDEKGIVKVREEDNAHILLEHDNGVISHIMCGFNYFDPFGHEAKNQTLHSIQIFGDKGNMRLIGYDWEPKSVVLDNSWTEAPQVVQTDDGGYQWQEGATRIAGALSKNIEPRINVLHSLHVLEIIEAARKSSKEGIKVKLVSSFPFPMV